jgi:hypothetical protein
MRVGLRFVVAALLLSTFWGGSPMRPSAFSWLGVAVPVDAPHFFGALSEASGLNWLRAWPGSLFDLSRALLKVHDEAGEHQAYALASVIGAVLLPLGLTLLLGPRSLRALGLRRPNHEIATLILAALAALVPLSVAMSFHPVFRAALDERLSGSRWFFFAAIVGTSAEHFFFHGVLLAWLHPSGSFPESPLLGAPWMWPGRMRDGRRASFTDALRSLAIPRDCLVPCLLSGPLFFLIHLGKPDAELWLSALAGPILAWLAYRTNGLVAPLIIHLAASVLGALFVALAWAM